MPHFLLQVSRIIEAETETEARAKLQEDIDAGTFLTVNEAEFTCECVEPAPVFQVGDKIVARYEKREFIGYIDAIRTFENGKYVYTVLDQNDKPFDIHESDILDNIG